tara:strand:+ start:537 stop:749 length:213 start_codon:yes stop_codon:yes gene_type:complete
MTAQESLHRIGAAFKSKPAEDLVKDIATKLDIELTPALMKSGDNAAITNALVELAVKNGKTEDEIAFALG